MKFEKKEAPYVGTVVCVEENGKTFRVGPKFPDEPDNLVLAVYDNGGSGWMPYRELTDEEKAEYHTFMQK